MIFDILGLVDFHRDIDGFNIGDIFNGKIYENMVGEKNCRKWRNFQIICLHRGCIKDDIFENNNLYITVIGEILLNDIGTKRFESMNPRLSAYHISRFYRNFGLDFVKDIKGNFQIIIIDGQEKITSIINSRFGISPFYYSFVNNTLVFSTNLEAVINCSVIKADLDKIGVAEYAIFGHLLGNRTIFKNVKYLPPASYLIVKSHFIEVKKYWDWENLLSRRLDSEQNAFEIASELFKKTVNQYVQEPTRISLSLTGGFDGRSILSVLDKEPENFQCYSFGIPKSYNISIPYKICKENAINYLPIYLDKNYEKVYERYALEAIFLSDCLSTFERANYPYAFERLSLFSPVVITGIFGSELLRTFQNISIGYMVNKNFVNLNFAQDKKKTLAEIIKNTRESSYYLTDIFRNDDELIDCIYEECFKKYAGLGDNQRFYLFLLNEGVRKYFGGEVHMERIYATNRFPFLDDDFVDFIFKSPFSGIYTNPLKPTVKQRYNSQLFYSYVIKKYRPELLNYPTDHGYPPKYLLSKMPLLYIGPSFVFNQIKLRITKYREFETEKWSENFYRKYLLRNHCDTFLFSNRLRDDFISGIWKVNRIDFARAVSLKLYLEGVIKG